MPNRKVFKFRRFDSFAQVERELSGCDLAFLLPHQAALLPDKSVDLFLNISSLHEMAFEQVATYFALIDRLTRGLFYSKQWKVSQNSRDHITIRQEDYPVRSHWQRLYERQARVQVQFFEALYRLPA